MLFSSTIFLFIFLPMVCLGYLFLKEDLKNYWLLLASLLFYAWGEPRYLSVMLFVILINYVIALLMDKYSQHKKVFLGLAVALNLSIKYTNFIIQNFNFVTGAQLKPINIVMPIGISFFIFQAISYIVDVYRREVNCQDDLRKLALYISFFPQLIAGPIVKYHDIEKEIDNRDAAIQDIIYGVRRFIIGLSKKVLIANTMGSVADSIYSHSPNELSYYIAWVGAIAYSLQIFFDFSGYSDMAIGIGRIFGFHFLENFNYPYIADSITDFWRRWHISLSTWFKQYLYIPLGGNRNGSFSTMRNLIIVFFATGIWHGASWNFIAWGMWHGFFIVMEKQFKSIFFLQNKILSHIYVVLIFVLGWVFFRADDLYYAVGYMKAMFGAYPNFHQRLVFFMNTKQILAMLCAIVFCFPINCEKIKSCVLGEIIYNAVLVGLLICSIASIAASTYNPFIYFRF